MAVHPLFTDRRSRRLPGAAGGATLASVLVADVRDDLFDGKYAPGDFLGTEKDLAGRHGVSRMVARDALRTLEAMGIVEIRRGAGGGASITRGNPHLFAEALAVQLQLARITPEEILEAQSGVECLAAELAATRATPDDIGRLRRLIAEAESLVHSREPFTRSSLQFHLALADASGNRVLACQLVSLQHISWPRRNRTLTVAVARRVIEAHRELTDLIEARDAAGARTHMQAHVRMIRDRRVGSSEKMICI
jgi:GntR family transcriptional regulator, transcriptional repressor for pyruvate dehydrogenase complex